MADTTSHVPTETSGSTAASRKLTRKPTHFSVVDAVRIDAETLRSRRAHWIAETPAKLDCRSRAAVVVDSGWWEIVVTLAICCDLGLTIASFLLSAEEADSFELFLAGGGVLIFLLLDVALRIVKDRLAFFLVALNWIEFVVAMAGLVTVLIEVEERLSAGSTGPKQPGASLGRTIRPVLRVFRVFRGFFTFFASRGGIQGRINKGVDKLFDHLVRKQLVEFLLMPSDNMTIQPSQGILHLEKAQIRSSRLTNMHMPLLLLAGIFDMVHFELKLGKLKVGAHRLMIFMQNVILVLGPGRSEERSADWNYADVKEAKTKTIRLAAKLLEGFAKPRKPNGEAKEGAAASVRREKQAGSSWVRRKMAKLLRDILNNGMQIAIHDFEIRYEDESSGICGPHRIVGGFVVDSLQLRAVSESHGHGDDTHRFRAKGAWRPGLGQNEEDEVQHNSFSWNMKTFSSALLSSRTAMSNMSHRLFDFSHGVHGGLHGHGIKVFWDMFPVDVSEASSSDMPAESGTRATSQFRLRLKEESGYNISDFLKTRKGLRMWEGLRYGICSVVMQKLLDERRGAEGVHLSAHRLREKSRRLRDIIGQHKYLVEPFHFTVHFVFRPVKGTGAHPQLDVDLKIQELSTLLDMTQLRGLCAILGYVQTWMRQDTLFQWKPPPAAYRQVSDTGGVGLNRGRMLWAYALRLVLFSIHPKYFWTSLAWIHMRRNACMRQALFEALAARNVDQERVEVLQVSLPLLECLAVRKEFLIYQATRKREESYFVRKTCCGCRRKLESADDDPLEAPEDQDDEGDFDIIDDELDFDDDAPADPAAQNFNSFIVEESVEVGRQISIEVGSQSGNVSASTSPQEKERRSFFGSRPKPKNKLDIGSAREFMQIAVTLRKWYFDLLYPPSANGRRRALLRLGTMWCQCLGVRGAPYRLWSCLAPPLVVVNVPKGDKFHNHPALALQVMEASAVFSAAPKEGPELRTFLAFDQKIMSSEKEKAGESRPVLQLRAAKLRSNAMSETEARLSPWGQKGVKSIPAPWKIDVCLEPFRANICKSFVLRVKDFLLSYLTVPSLNPAELTKRALPDARWLEDPCHLWVQLQEIRKQRHLRHKHLKFGRRLEMAMGLRGPLANGQRFFGSVIFPGGFTATLLEIYHENKWMRLLVSAPAGTQDFRRLGWPVEGTGGYRPFQTGTPGNEPVRASDGWWFETEEQRDHFVSVQAAGGIQVSHAFQGAKLNEEPAMEPSALAGQPPNVAGRGLPRQAASKKTVAEPKESTNLLLSCAAQVAGPTAIIAASMAAEAGRLAAARISAHVPACGQVEKATDNADSPPTRPRRRRSSLSLPAGARAINVPKKTFTEMAEETALSVTIEVLPKGALGLPPPSMLPAWWQELGLVRPDYHIPSR